MAQQIINNGDTGLAARTKLNDNFTETYNGAGNPNVTKDATTVVEPPVIIFEGAGVTVADDSGNALVTIPGGGGGGGVDEIQLNSNLTQFQSQNATIGNVEIKLSEIYPLSLQGRDTSGISALTIQSLNGVDVTQIGSFEIEEVLTAFSTATDQKPVGIDAEVQIEFGAAQKTSDDPVSILVDGTLEINQAGHYLINTLYNADRDGVGNRVSFRHRKLLSKLESGVPSTVQIGHVSGKTIISANDTETIPDDFILHVPTLPDPFQWVSIQGDYTNNSSTSFVETSTGDLFVSAGPGAAQPFVHKSVDGGTNWTPFATGLTDGIYDLGINSNDDIYAAMDVGGVFRLSAGTGTWVADGVGLPAIPVVSLFVDEGSGFIYAGTDGQGVYTKPLAGSAGQTWTVANTGMNTQVVRRIVRVGDKLYAAAGNEVFLNTVPASGLWIGVFTGQGSQRGITADKAGNLYVTGDCPVFNDTLPVFKSAGGFSPWIQVGIGSLPISSFPDGGYAIKSIPETNSIYVGGTIGLPSFSSNDGGVTWGSHPLLNVNKGLFLKNSVLYGVGGTSNNFIAKLNLNSVPVTIAFMQWLDSINTGQNDGGLFQLQSNAVLVPPAPPGPTSSMTVSRLKPFKDVVLGSS